MPRITVNNHALHYNDTGEGDPVVLLHNGFYSSACWDSVREALAVGYRVIDYDRYGYGRSDHFPDDSVDGDVIEHGVDELGSLLDGLGLETVHLVGHCLGGAVALLFAVRNPGRVGRVVASSVGYFGDFKSLIKTDMTFVPFQKIERVLRRRMVRMHGGEYTRRLWSVLRSERSYIMSDAYDIRAEVARLAAPLLIVNGDRDFYFDVDHPLEIYRKLRKTAELWIAPGCGHDVHIEAPEAFVQTVTRFLTKTIASPSPPQRSYVQRNSSLDPDVAKNDVLKRSRVRQSWLRGSFSVLSALLENFPRLHGLIKKWVKRSNTT